jgi:type II secretory pathway component PulF
MPATFFPTVARLLPAWPVRRRESLAVVRLLAACDAAGVEAAPILTAWAAEERPAQQRRLEACAARLRDGTPPAAAIAPAAGEPRVMHEDHAAAVRFGLAERALPEVAAAVCAVEPSFDRPVPLLGWYIVIVTLTALAVSGMLSSVILPRFLKVLSEFGMAADDVSRSIAVMAIVFSIIGVGMLLLAIAAGVVLAGWLLPSLRQPLVRWWTRRRSRATALAALAGACRAGRPVSEAVRTLADSQPDAALDRAFRAVADATGPLGGRLAAQRLLAAVEGRYVDAAAAAADEAGALERLARRSRADGAGRGATVRGVLFTTALSLLAMLVTVHALAVFGPLTRLIRGLT